MEERADSPICCNVTRRTQDDENYLGEDVFKVEKIVDRRRFEGEIQYLIKWEGWSR